MAQDKMLKFLVEGLTRAFDKQEDCDVMFSVDGQTIGAHRLILNIHSQVLYEMAAGWTPDKDPIAIDDMSFDSFKALLRYMYSSEIPLSNDTVFVYLAASTNLKMNILEEHCVGHIISSMRTENVCYYMNEAVNFNSMVLQEKCCDMFQEKTGQIASHSSFKNLSQPALSALLGVDQTNMVEASLFQYARQWMEEQCRDRGLPVNGTNMRQVIGDALYKIRFPTMNVQDFANSVTMIKGFLTENERVQVFEKITVLDNEDIECPFSDEYRCQISHYYKAFSDVEKLLKEKIFYNAMSKQHCDISSALQFAKDQPNCKEICTSVHSVRFVLQCCADLANSCPVQYHTKVENQNCRNEIYDEFKAWQNVVATKNVSEIMAKFMQLRMKLEKLYTWSW